jgi:pilus assembly protein CpaE
MVIAYVSTVDKGCFTQLRDEFEDVKNLDSIDEFINFYASGKSRDIVLIYRVNSEADLNKLTEIHFGNNIYIIVIGQRNIEMSLRAGKIGVDSYVSEDEVNPDVIRTIVVKSQNVIKKRRGQSNISVLAGISGGVGTTTISLNLANMIAKKHLDKNVLYLDFADTKSIVNIFFDRYNKPEKTIIDIATVNNLEMDELFGNGLLKYTDNFYYIPGIQKHTEREALEKPENIQRFLNFINYIKGYFDIILIDVGVFKDSELEIDIQEIADHIYMITELSVPSLSILKTYIDIIDKSGWYSKTEIFVNRSDSFGTVTEEEARMILSKGMKHTFDIGFSIPNDARPLRECWNDALLVSDTYPKTKFVQSLEEVIERFFISSGPIFAKGSKNSAKKESFLEKIKAMAKIK